MTPAVIPQLVANDGTRAMRAAIADPERFSCEPKVDGVRGLEGIVLKDRTSTYRDGSRAGWTKVKDRSWYERESWRFDRR
jgi:ATP-dependent DNA ligase